MKKLIKSILLIVAFSIVATVMLNFLNRNGYLDFAKSDLESTIDDFSEETKDIDFNGMGNFRKSMEDKLGYKDFLQSKSTKSSVNRDESSSISRKRTSTVQPKMWRKGSNLQANIEVPKELRTR